MTFIRLVFISIENFVRRCASILFRHDRKKIYLDTASLDDQKIYESLKRMIDEKQKIGIRAHAKHIPYDSSMKDYIKMFRWVELDNVIQLKSEPFEKEADAIHFMKCFEDNFLYNPYIEREENAYYVYSGWIIKYGFYSYTLSSKGMYYTFANWS